MNFDYITNEYWEVHENEYFDQQEAWEALNESPTDADIDQMYADYCAEQAVKYGMYQNEEDLPF